MEPESLSISDLTLEKQISFLEAFKSWKDVEKGHAKGKGFANSFNMNLKRNSHVYTTAEQLFKDVSDSFSLNSVHELRIRLKDRDNHLHCFKLDFFYPNCRIDVEVSPDFHLSYKLVAIRDKLKELLLKRANIRVYHLRVYFKHGTTFIDLDKAEKLCKLIKDAETCPDCLTYWQ
jgi:hypothetical protein